VGSAKARDLLGWTETDPHQALARSVAWHLANPPDDAAGDFTANDEALGEFNWSSQHLDDEELRWHPGDDGGRSWRVGLRCGRLVDRR
jgi:hypothetical protein